jgi:hypothetical protein
MFAHPNDTRYWISVQDNIVFQWHPSFYAKYSGPHSLNAHAENATSHVGTLYLGYELRKTTEVFLDVEEASGGGISDALGLAGPTNLDVVRNPLLSKAPYLARAMVRQIIPLSDETVEAVRGPFALATTVPARRLELRAGKFSMPDFFDFNDVGSAVLLGADLAGDRWRRKQDKIGTAFVSNGISAVHQKYLELGGLGFLLGDGALNYGRETIFEGYYNAHVWRGVFAALDVQHINNPGYNRDRGPVLVPGVRVHLEF